MQSDTMPAVRASPARRGAAAPRARARGGPVRGIRAAVRRLGLWNLALFAGSFALYLVVGGILITRLVLTGDEPWYVMLAYSLVHSHTPDLAAIINDPPVYHQFLYHFDDHTRDYLGNGERLLPNLPGYAALIGPLYAIGGRAGILVLQAVLQAITVVLLFHEGRRIFGSRAAGLFASLAFAFSLTALVYVGQAFPSAVASFLIFVGFILATRVLPLRRDRAQLAAAVVTGAAIAFLPWLHFKYALVALALLGLALWRLRPREWLRWPARGTPERATTRAAAVVAGIVAFSFLLIALYSHRYFGTWTPQYTPVDGGGMDFAHPNVRRALILYGDVFLSPQSGLFSWVPLDLLAIPGIVLLWRRDARQALAILLVVGAQLGGFLTVLFTGLIYQGYALPSRFTVEVAPFFALCAAATFAAGWPALRDGLREAYRAVRLRMRAVGPAVRSRAADGAPAWRTVGRTGARALPALCALVLLLAGAEFIAASMYQPDFLYGSHAGNRFVEKYPHALPGWWFGLFPDADHVVWYTDNVLLDQDAAGGQQGAEPVSIAWHKQADVPPGRYAATFSFTCAPAAAGATASAPIELVVERVVGLKHARIAAERVPASLCAGAASEVSAAVPFTSIGYDPTAFRLLAGPAAGIAGARVTYAPLDRDASPPAPHDLPVGF